MITNVESRSVIKEFHVTSGALRVTDPCYTIDTWCSGQLDDVLNGTWLAQVYYKVDDFDTQMKAKHRQQTIDDINTLRDRMKQTDNWKLKAIPNYDKMMDEDAESRTSMHRKSWSIEDQYDKGRVACIRVCHYAHDQQFTQGVADEDFERHEFDVGVDSGQAGFFDLAEYAHILHDYGCNKARGDAAGFAGEFDKFYTEVCAGTSLPESFNTNGFGAFSQTGYGDGGYTCYSRKVDGKVVDAYIVFIDSHNEEDDEEEDSNG